MRHVHPLPSVLLSGFRLLTSPDDAADLLLPLFGVQSYDRLQAVLARNDVQLLNETPSTRVSTSSNRTCSSLFRSARVLS